MLIYILTTSPDCFSLISRELEKAGHNCLLFKNTFLFNETISKQDCMANLLIIDYLCWDHENFNMLQEMEYHNKYIPFFYYNNPLALLYGNPGKAWELFIESCNKRFSDTKTSVFMPEIKETIKSIESMIFNTKLKQYLILTLPKDFPSDYKTINDFSETDKKLSSDDLTAVKKEINLPENLFFLLKVLARNLNEKISYEKISEIYKNNNKTVTEKSLVSLVSQLRTYLSRSSSFKYKIKKCDTGYILSDNDEIL